MSTGTRRYKAWLRDIVGIFQDDRLVFVQREMTMEGGPALLRTMPSLCLYLALICSGTP